MDIYPNIEFLSKAVGGGGRGDLSYIGCRDFYFVLHQQKLGFLIICLVAEARCEL